MQQPIKNISAILQGEPNAVTRMLMVFKVPVKIKSYVTEIELMVKM